MKTKPTVLSAIFATIFALCISALAQAAEYNHDTKSAALADAVVEAMGGRQNYDNLHYLSWNFFGRRFHIWDKYTGDIRIEYGENLQHVLLMNVHSKEGRVWEDGKEITEEAALAEKMKWGYEVWINDSYWVVMPFKLHDPGVNLAYTREDISLDGDPVDVLTMTFNEVGVTPDNKYELFISKDSKRVIEFAFYQTSDATEPRFRLPWNNYQNFAKVMLADSRGDGKMSPIQVFSELPKSVFTDNALAVDTEGKRIKRTSDAS